VYCGNVHDIDSDTTDKYRLSTLDTMQKVGVWEWVVTKLPIVYSPI